MAASNIEFVSGASDEQATEFLSKTKALIFPGEEDLGILYKNHTVPCDYNRCADMIYAYT